MKQFSSIFSVLVCFAMCCFSDTVIDFSNDRHDVSYWSECRVLNPCSLAFQQNPATGKQALLASWDAHATGVMDINEKAPEYLGPFSVVKITADITVPEPSRVQDCQLLLKDKTGEAFHFSHPVDWSKPGHYVIDYILDLYDLRPTRIVMPNSRRNERIDFPLSSLGLSLLFPKDDTRGKIYINAIALQELKSAPVPESVLYPMVPLAKHWCVPADMPQRISANAKLEIAANPETNGKSLKITADFQSKPPQSPATFGFAFTTGGYPRGVMCPMLPKYDGAEATLRLTTLRPMPEITAVKIGWLEHNAGLYFQNIQLNLDKAGQHAIRVALPAEVKAHQPYFVKSKAPLWRLFNVVFASSDPQADSTLFLDAIDLDVSSSPLEKVTLDITSESGDYVFGPANRSQGIPAQLTNASSTPVTFLMQGNVVDVDGKRTPWFEQKKLTLAPAETAQIPTITIPELFGPYQAEVTLSAGAMQPTTLRQRFAYMNLTGESKADEHIDGFLFGGMMHWDLYKYSLDEIDKAAKRLSQIGLKVLRNDIRLPSDPLAMALQDYVIDTFRKHGMMFDFIILAQWTDGKVDIEKSKRHFEKLFTKYKGKVRFWEVLNEPDMYWGVPPKLTVEDYVNLAKAAKEVLRKVDPDAKLLSAGFAYTGEGHKMTAYFHYNAMKELRNHFDIHCFHGHGTFDKFVHEQIDPGLIAMRKELGITTPWYANETAVYSATGITEKEQAMAGFKKPLYAWSRGAIGLNWYNYRNLGDIPGCGVCNYGMMTLDLRPKPVYVALNALTGLYRDKRFVKAFDMKEDHFGFVFEGTDCRVVALWNELLPETVTLKTDATRAEVSDLFGNRTPIAISPEGLLTITNSINPQSIILYGATDVTLLAEK